MDNNFGELRSLLHGDQEFLKEAPEKLLYILSTFDEEILEEEIIPYVNDHLLGTPLYLIPGDVFKHNFGKSLCNLNAAFITDSSDLNLRNFYDHVSQLFFPSKEPLAYKISRGETSCTCGKYKLVLNRFDNETLELMQGEEVLMTHTTPPAVELSLYFIIITLLGGENPYWMDAHFMAKAQGKFTHLKDTVFTFIKDSYVGGGR